MNGLTAEASDLKFADVKSPSTGYVESPAARTQEEYLRELKRKNVSRL